MNENKQKGAKNNKYVVQTKRRRAKSHLTRCRRRRRHPHSQADELLI